MRKLMLVVAAVVLLPLAATAQDDVPAVDIFGGYSYLRFNVSEDDEQALGTGAENTHGFNASVAFNLNRNLAVVADVAGHFKDFEFQDPFDPAGTITVDTSQYTVMFGPRFSARTERINPFAHALFGFGRLSFSEAGFDIDDTGFAMALGGGLDVNLNDNFSLRLAQADYVLNRYGFEDIDPGLETQSFNNLRLSFGVVFHVQ
jgi:opacity protein-like surface antigen